MRKKLFCRGVFALLLTGLLFANPVLSSDGVRDYTIKAQNLHLALKEFQDISGLDLAWSDALVEGKTSTEVRGEYSATQALRLLLTGTGLDYVQTGQGTLVLTQKETFLEQPPLQKQITQKKETAFVAQSSLMAMDQVVVTATKTPIKTKEVPAAVNVVSDEDIELRANTDNFIDTIGTLPGVTVVRGGMSDTLSIRGMNPSILVNGRDMNFFASLTGPEQIGMGSIERIEVIKGPQAAIYGAKAVSGVVNIIQKKGDANNPFGEIRGFLGQEDEYSFGTSLDGGIDKFSYFLDMTLAEQDKYETPKGDIPYMDSDRTNILGRFDYAFFESHELTFDFSHNRSQKTVGGDGYYYFRSEWNNLYGFESTYQGGGVTYNGKFSDFFSLYVNFGLGKQEYELIMGMPNYEPEHFLNKENETFYKEDVLQGEIRGTANLFSDDKLRLIAGLQYKKMDLDGNSKRTVGGTKVPFFVWDVSEKYIAPYTQLEFKPVPYLLMVAGIRYDDYKSAGKKYSATSPNVGLSLFPFAGRDYDWTTLWGSYSKGFRTPGAPARFLPGFLGGNPDLEPEKSKGWEIGLKQRISKWANIETSYFETDYTNLIFLKSLGPNEWLFVNEAESTFKGYELLAEFYPVDWLILHFGYTNMDKEDAKSGKKLYGTPDLVFQYGLTIPDFYGFSFSLWGSQYKDFKFRKGMSHPSENASIWNAKAKYHWNITERILFEPFVSVENLSDETYYTLVAGEVGIMEGRTWNMGANLRMDF